MPTKPDGGRSDDWGRHPAGDRRSVDWLRAVPPIADSRPKFKASGLDHLRAKRKPRPTDEEPPLDAA
jgi:hypothetical protein